MHQNFKQKTSIPHKYTQKIHTGTQRTSIFTSRQHSLSLAGILILRGQIVSFSEPHRPAVAEGALAAVLSQQGLLAHGGQQVNEDLAHHVVVHTLARSDAVLKREIKNEETHVRIDFQSRKYTLLPNASSDSSLT